MIHIVHHLCRIHLLHHTLIEGGPEDRYIYGLLGVMITEIGV